MKHFRFGKNAQVVVYVVGIQLVIVVNFDGSHKSIVFGRAYDGNYTHLNPENLLPDYQAFDEAEALLMASRAGEVEPLDEPEEVSDLTDEEISDLLDKDITQAVHEGLKGPDVFAKIAVHADITEEDIQANLAPAPVNPTVDPKLEPVLSTTEPVVEVPTSKK